MVTRAIEKAQNTVEARNGEIRKNVLKYDEVPNEQRKVIYARRDQVLVGLGPARRDPRGHGRGRSTTCSATHCGADYAETGTSRRSLADAATYWPVTLERVGTWPAPPPPTSCTTCSWPTPSRHYEAREAEFGEETMRQIERQVMLQVIDARWRDHLKEMDHLHDGINLRALGQKDPLSEWQREGYDMFGSSWTRSTASTSST